MFRLFCELSESDTVRPVEQINDVELFEGAWKVWTGGDCPVPIGTQVVVMLRNGRIRRGSALRDIVVGQDQWRYGKYAIYGATDSDIVMYRIGQK